MAPTPQTLKNHARLYPPFHLFAVPVLMLNVLDSIRRAWIAPSFASAFALLVAMALLVGVAVSRGQVIAVQNRLIRLEMQLRLQRVLPADLQAKVAALTVPQLIALRFASDEELPELCREVLAGTCTTQKAIKERVKEWQADHLRA